MPPSSWPWSMRGRIWGLREDVYGWIPLHLAAGFNNNATVITALIDAGADVGARDDDGDTPLHLACCANNPAVIMALDVLLGRI